MLGLLAFMYSCQIYAEVHPVLFKDDSSLYSNVYFGMGFDEFKSKVGSNIFECKDSTNKKMADIGCKVSFRFGGSGVSEAVAIFKNNNLIAILGRVNSDFYGSVISNLSSIYKDQPQTENRDERKGLFSNKISNEYSIWSYPDYLMLVSKFDIPKYVENGTNFLLAVESANDNFINYMQIESRKKSNINIHSKVPNIDVSKLHLSNDSPANTGANKIDAAVISQIPANNNSNNSEVTTLPVGQVDNQKNTRADRTLLSLDLTLGTKKELIKNKVNFCSKEDKFLTEFRKNFPKFIVDEYCVGSNLIKDIQADTLFLVKDGVVKSVVHRANLTEFRKLSLLYKETIGNEPKSKQVYKGLKPISCFSDEGLSDYVEFCKQEVDGFVLVAGNASEINSGLQNRTKFMQILKGFSITPPASLQSGPLIVNDVKKTSKKTKEIAKNDSLQNEKSSSSKLKWDLEPKSFMGISLNEPLISSINDQCTSSGKQLCYEVNKIYDKTFLEIKNPPITQFGNIYISTLGGNNKDPYSKVGRIEVSFNTDDFETIRNILIEKYGLPHSTDVGIVKTNGGAEFKNYQNYWLGNNVSIVIESLVTRGYTSGRYGSFYSYGAFSLTTKEYLEQTGEARSNKVKSEADKL